MEKEQIKKKLASAASMPKDVVMGASVVTVLGMSEVCIENYSGDHGVYRHSRTYKNKTRTDTVKRKLFGNRVLYE